MPVNQKDYLRGLVEMGDEERNSLLEKIKKQKYGASQSNAERGNADRDRYRKNARDFGVAVSDSELDNWYNEQEQQIEEIKNLHGASVTDSELEFNKKSEIPVGKEELQERLKRMEMHKQGRKPPRDPSLKQFKGGAITDAETGQVLEQWGSMDEEARPPGGGAAQTKDEFEKWMEILNGLK